VAEEAPESPRHRAGEGWKKVGGWLVAKKTMRAIEERELLFAVWKVDEI